MPFQETCVLAERISVLKDYDTGVFTVAGLSRRYGVSRETIYVWKRRRDKGCTRWFEDRSHAAAVCPHATPPEQAGAIIATRERFPHFAPTEKTQTATAQCKTIVVVSYRAAFSTALEQWGLPSQSFGCQDE